MGALRKPPEFRGPGKTVSGVALVFLCIAFIMCALSFCAPFWVTHKTEYYDMGLWGKCFFNAEKAGRSGCRWMWDFDWALERAMPSWFRAAQALFGFGIMALLIAFIIAMAQICCDIGFGKSKVYVVIGGTVLLAWAMMCIAIVTYGVREYLEEGTSDNSAVKRFGWAFIVGITGIVVSCASGIMYLLADCLIRQTRRQEGYERSIMELRG